MDVVLDACAIIAYLRGEPGSDVVEALLLDEHNTCVVHAINLCEVYYDFVRAAGEPAAQSALTDVEAVGIITRDDMDGALWQSAGRLKARGRIALPDCFVIALAQREGAPVVTCDHNEFDPIAAAGICAVSFFR